MSSITAANAVVMLSIPPLFPIPIQVQGFAADDVFDVDAIESNEVVMGVDGIMSSGFVFVPIPQTFTLQADSPSVFIFDNWWEANQVLQDAFRANGVITLTALNKKWTCSRGALTSYKPMPDAKKLLQPQKFRITWERVSPAVT